MKLETLLQLADQCETAPDARRLLDTMQTAFEMALISSHWRSTAWRSRIDEHGDTDLYLVLSKPISTYYVIDIEIRLCRGELLAIISISYVFDEPIDLGPSKVTIFPSVGVDLDPTQTVVATANKLAKQAMARWQAS